MQEDAKGVPNIVGVELLEALSAVTALEEESSADGGLREALLEGARLAGKHDGRERLHRPQHLVQVRLVRVFGLLQRRAAPPAADGPLARGPRRRADGAGAEERPAAGPAPPLPPARRGEGRVRRQRGG